ncbi:MAG: hypothetical protein R6V72_23630 [Cyclobacterium sp.]|uniref:hypothetical protein n=1 Tax=Cyclobacterium sp. TaxID=1966343 RepID=UPI003970BE7C
MSLLTLAFYAQGIFSEQPVFMWSGHIVALFTVIYGYAILFRRKNESFFTIGRKTYGIFDMAVTLGLVYFLFHVSYFDRFSPTESFFMITAIVLIITGKLVYYLRKGVPATT